MDLAAPEKPVGPLSVKNLGSDSVTLAWKAPKDDGGNPITGYKIQVSQDNADWSDLDTLDKFSKEYTAKNLKEGKDYKFRVCAINKVGTGQPLESEVITPTKAKGRSHSVNQYASCLTF